MLRTRIISFVCILLCITTGARAEDYKWKVKDGKMALFSKPYKGKWGQVTDYIYDVNFSASYCSDKNKKPYFFDRHYSLIQVKNSQLIQQVWLKLSFNQKMLMENNVFFI